MNTITLRFLPLLLLFVFVIACDRPKCQNTNSIFDLYSPESKEYKVELAKQIEKIGLQKLRYWFDKSQNINAKEYFELYIQGNGLCAKIIVENQSNKKLGIGGYRGAELKGITIRTESDSLGINYILEKIDRIID